MTESFNRYPENRLTFMVLDILTKLELKVA